MEIDFDALLLGPVHAALGVDAVIEQVDAAPFQARVMRHFPAAEQAPFVGSQAQTDLYIFEVRAAVWAVPRPGDVLATAKYGRLRVQAARPDERQPDVWLLDCYPEG